MSDLYHRGINDSYNLEKLKTIRIGIGKFREDLNIIQLRIQFFIFKVILFLFFCLSNLISWRNFGCLTEIEFSSRVSLNV